VKLGHGRYYLWGVIATIAGLLIATQPLETTLAVFIGVILGLIVLAQPVISVGLLLILSPVRALLLTEAPQLSILDPGLLGLAISLITYFVYRSIRRQSWFTIRFNLLHIVIMIFLFVAWISSFFAISYQAWLQDWLKWLLIFVLMIVIQDYHKYWYWLVSFLVIAGTANAIVGVYIFFGGSGADHLVIMDQYFRAFGTFGQPNPFGGYMGLVLPLALAVTAYSFLYARAKHDRNSFFIAWLYAIASAVMLFALLMSWSRGAWLGFAGSLVIMVISIPRTNKMRVFILSLSIISAAIVWSLDLLPSSIMQRVDDVAQQYLSFSEVRGLDITTVNYAGVERIAHWQAAVNMATNYPWLGVGLGNYEIAYSTYRLENWQEALGHAHNYYLNILAEGGIITFLAYVILWGTIITTTWRARNHPDRRMHWISIGLLGSWTYLSIHSLIDNLYVNNLYFHIAVMLAIASMILDQLQHPFRWRHYDTVIGYQF
jgi:O-antigen ligase